MYIHSIVTTLNRHGVECAIHNGYDVY